MENLAFPPISPWARHARQWSLVGSPLRPGVEDSRLYWGLIDVFVESCVAPRVLILGVTPELALLPWPSQSYLTAIDMSQDMIDEVWPINELRCGGEAICTTWQKIPIPDASVDIVIGDGSLSALSDSREYPVVFAEIHRILRPGGQFVLRCFVHPDVKEPIDQVFEDLDAGLIKSMHTLKWRIAMSLQTSIADGVGVSAIRDCFISRITDRKAAATRLGWPIAEMNTIDAYEGSDVTYTFPTLAEIDVAIAGWFDVGTIVKPLYELGERCPVIRFNRKS